MAEHSFYAYLTLIGLIFIANFPEQPLRCFFEAFLINALLFLAGLWPYETTGAIN